MKNQLVIPTLVSAVLCASNVAYAEHALPYLGLDVMTSKTNLQQDFGGRLFYNKAAAVPNFFIGYCLSDWVAFEIGYQYNDKKNRSVRVPATSSEFNIPNFAGIQSFTFNSKKKISSFNFNVAPKINVNETVSILPVLGFSYFNTKLNLNVSTIDNVAATAQNQVDYNANFSSKKLVPRLGLRFQLSLIENFSLRVSALWENTATIKPTTTRNIAPDTTLTAKFKNTTSLGIGLYCQL